MSNAKKPQGAGFIPCKPSCSTATMTSGDGAMATLRDSSTPSCMPVSNGSVMTSCESVPPAVSHRSPSLAQCVEAAGYDARVNAVIAQVVGADDSRFKRNACHCEPQKTG